MRRRRRQCARRRGDAAAPARLGAGPRGAARRRRRHRAAGGCGAFRRPRRRTRRQGRGARPLHARPRGLRHGSPRRGDGGHAHGGRPLPARRHRRPQLHRRHHRPLQRRAAQPTGTRGRHRLGDGQLPAAAPTGVPRGGAHQPRRGALRGTGARQGRHDRAAARVRAGSGRASHPRRRRQSHAARPLDDLRAARRSFVAARGPALARAAGLRGVADVADTAAGSARAHRPGVLPALRPDGVLRHLDPRPRGP